MSVPDLKKEWRKVKLLDSAILLYHVHRGAQHPKVGFEDTNRSLDQLTHALGKPAWIEKPVVESALWSANLLDEQNQFWHPKGLNFTQFVQTLLGPGEAFDLFYNTIQGKK